MAKGQKNLYLCDDCQGYTVTIDVDEGHTPKYIACRASGSAADCRGRAVSLDYPSEPWPEFIPSEARWEFFRQNHGASPSDENRAVEKAIEWTELAIRSIRVRQAR